MPKRLLWLLPLILLVGCPKVEQNARDTAAGLKGVLTQAQNEYTASCQSNAAQTACSAINRGIAAQNALITATEGYCGWSTTAPPPDPTVKCVPVKGTEAALQSAIQNANQAITEIKAVIKP